MHVQRNKPTIFCAHCGTPFQFQSKHPDKRFCSRKCARLAAPRPAPRYCSIPDCGRPHYAHGWCNTHYMRWWNKGTVDLTRCGPLRERFPRLMDCSGDGCYRWIGPIGSTGYGVTVDDNGRSINAHRASYLLYVGSIPPGKLVRHLCNNRWCVNPAHLAIGTQKDNMEDSITAGTFARGSRNGHAKLTETTVREIRTRRSERYSRLAAEYGVSTCTIGEIMRRESWAHLD